MKTSLFLLLLAGPAALAQTVPAPAGAPAPVVLRPGHMQAQAHGGAANRPDKAPQYPGGPQALGAFFQDHLKYPEAARVKSITGNVLLSATVGTDGQLSGLKVAQPLSPECDAEALRVAALLPPWQPATRLGVPLPVAIQLPVPFGNGATLKVLK
ncbi:energy transducer TonB [Hymenobacter caeli]|uniref:Protein TonB n=1 Tax=Hymenobacter caeli TaxID=2735894 RepID=A0ABX2FK02_9BACT|nr:energy transducer TonB [Hymenobacter caeli]NRT17446.1 protein TonB [Hymenobacter caeli]